MAIHADELLFLHEIRAHPASSQPRQIYADWLEERGDRRASYLRLECALAGRPHVAAVTGPALRTSG